jgi:hypothetical protein
VAPPEPEPSPVVPELVVPEPLVPVPEPLVPAAVPAPLAIVGTGELEEEPQPDMENITRMAALDLINSTYFERFMIFYSLLVQDYRNLTRNTQSASH